MAFQQTSSKPQTLETKLDDVENILGRLSFGVGKEALSILDDLDQAKQRIDQLNEQGTPPKAEIAQFDSVCAMLRKEGREYLKQIGGVSVLKARRDEVHPPRENWWWYLDEELAIEQKKLMISRLRAAGIIFVVLLVVVIIYQVFFAPDPKVIASVSAQQDADLALSEGNLNDALAAIDEGLTKVPDAPELLIYKATILNALGKTEEAKPILQEAQQMMANQEMFVLTQAQILNMMNNPEGALEILEELLVDYPQSAKAYLLIGQANETMGNQKGALDAYAQAAEIAEKNGDTTTTAQARIKSAMLMQVYGMPQFDLTPTVTAAP